MPQTGQRITDTPGTMASLTTFQLVMELDSEYRFETTGTNIEVTETSGISVTWPDPNDPSNSLLDFTVNSIESASSTDLVFYATLTQINPPSPGGGRPPAVTPGGLVITVTNPLAPPASLNLTTANPLAYTGD